MKSGYGLDVATESLSVEVAASVTDDVTFLDAPTHVHLAYRPGVPLVDTVVRGGEVVTG